MLVWNLPLPYYDPATRHWWLNPSNNTSDVSASTLWETAKAYIRGVIISYTSAKRKKPLRQQLELESQISVLEREFKQSLSKSSRLKLDAACSALDNLLTQKAETAIFYARHQNLYQVGKLQAPMDSAQNFIRKWPNWWWSHSPECIQSPLTWHITTNTHFGQYIAYFKGQTLRLLLII